MSLRALLFDFDGVLADTENIHVAAWERTFADLGWEVPDEVCAGGRGGRPRLPRQRLRRRGTSSGATCPAGHSASRR